MINLRIDLVRCEAELTGVILYNSKDNKIAFCNFTAEQ